MKFEVGIMRTVGRLGAIAAKLSLVFGIAAFAARPAEAGTLPEGYTELGCLISHGTEYINSEYTPTKDCRIVLDFAYTTGAKAGDHVLGFGASGNAQSIRLFRVQDASTGVVSYRVNFDDYYPDLCYINRGTTLDTDRHVIDVSNASKMLDGAEIDGVYFEPGKPTDNKILLTKTLQGPLYLFAANQGWAPVGDAFLPAPCKIYSCQIYDGTTLKRDFVPCRRNANNALVLYDLVGQKEYANKGTGTFESEEPGKIVMATLTGVKTVVDGQPHGPVLTVTDPAEGYQVEWSLDNATYVPTRPTFTELGQHAVFCRVSADGYAPRNLYATVNINGIYTLAGTDESGASAMDGTGTFGWTYSSGVTTKNHKPSAGNDYVADQPYILRTPMTSGLIFGGDSLTLSGGVEIKVKVPNNGIVTIPNLIVAGDAQIVCGEGNRLMKVAGAIDILEAGALKIDVSYDNVPASVRQFEIQSTISGAGSLWTGVTIDGTSGSPYVKFTKSLADFTGKIVLGAGDTMRFATVFNSDLPGDPDVLIEDGLVFEGKAALEFNVSGRLGITRGVTFNSGQGEIYVAEGQTVQIDGQLVGEAGFKKTGKGTLALANISPDLFGAVTVMEGKLQLCDEKETALPEAEIIVASGAILDEHGPVVDHDPLVEATLTGVDVVADGQPYGPVLTVTDPAEGWQASWSTDGVTYTSTRPTFTEPGGYTVFCRVSATGYIARKLRTTLRIRPPARFVCEFTATVNYKGTETLVDFPVLVRLPMTVTSRMRNDGRDVRFYLEDGTTELAHECESFDRVKGALCWVKIPALSPGMKLVIKFRDPEFDTEPDAAAVWSSYIGVWHLDNVMTACVDSTGGTPNATVDSSRCSSVGGKLLTACRMIGTTDWTAPNIGRVTVNNQGSLATSGKLTATWWMKPNGSGAMPRTMDKASYLLQMKDVTKGYLFWDVRYQMGVDAVPSFNLRAYKEKSTSPMQVVISDADTKLNLPDWLHLACTIEDNAEHTSAIGSIWADAVLEAQGALNPLLSAEIGDQFLIGNSGGGDNYKGQMDELRLRAVVSSADWIKAERDSVDDLEFVKLPDDLDKRFVVTRRVVATEAEKTGAWADAVVAGNDAYVALQGVIDASANYDTILVKAGTYNLTQELSFASDVLTGVTFRSDDGAGNLARKTTLLVGGYPATMNRLVYIATPGVIVDGFTLSNGYVNEAPGGGAYLDNCGADAGLRNCDIVRCTAWNEAYLTKAVGFSNGTGGGAFIYNSGCISNCLFKENVSFAGAVSMVGTKAALTPPKDTPWVTHCEFVWNEQIGLGTANNCNGSAVASKYACCIDHCSIVSNFCNVTSGVQISTVGNLSGYLIISNCVFQSNGLGTRKVKLIGTNSPSTIRCVGNTFIDEVANPIMSNVDGCNRNAMINCTGVLGVSTVYNCLFVGNTNSSDTGCLSGACTAENCTFIGNKGAIYSNGSAATASRTNRIVNCVFLGNEKDVYAINSGNATPIALFVSNCCIRAWSLDQKSGSNRQFGLVITNDCNILYSDEDLAAVQRSIVRFRNPAAGDWRLKRKSLLRDAGMVRPWMNGAVDRDGLPRCLDRKGRASEDALPDIGAYECEIFPNGLVVTIQQIEEASAP